MRLEVSFILLLVNSADAFSNALFQQAPTEQLTFPSKTPDGIEIELPNFDELFGRVEQVSPLARVAIAGTGQNGNGFEGTDDSIANLEWKTIENRKKKRGVYKVEKIDNFRDLGCPLLRFRVQLDGPSFVDGHCAGEALSNFMTKTEDRSKWDAQIDHVYEAYPINDLDAANIAMGFNKYGSCSRLGVGHCLTKSNLGIDAREQLTMCGINDFPDKSCLIWGTEMAAWHDHLLPPGKRVTRATSHIFSTTLVPTTNTNNPNLTSFDVEYVIQLDIGGKIPTFLTTPIVIDNVKKLFKCAQNFFDNKDGEVERFSLERASKLDLSQGPSLLVTP